MSTVLLAKYFPASDVQENIMARITGGKRRADWEKSNKNKPSNLDQVLRLARMTFIAENILPHIKRVFAKHNPYCGCSSCPCSPGFDIRVEVEPCDLWRVKSNVHPHIYGKRDGSVVYRKEKLVEKFDKRTKRYREEKRLGDQHYLIIPVRNDYSS